MLHKCLFLCPKCHLGRYQLTQLQSYWFNSPQSLADGLTKRVWRGVNMSGAHGLSSHRGEVDMAQCESPIKGPHSMHYSYKLLPNSPWPQALWCPADLMSVTMNNGTMERKFRIPPPFSWRAFLDIALKFRRKIFRWKYFYFSDVHILKTDWLN